MSINAINEMIEKMSHYDKDERYMATNDLCNQLGIHSVTHLLNYLLINSLTYLHAKALTSRLTKPWSEEYAQRC